MVQVRKVQYSFLFLLILTFLLAGSTSLQMREKPSWPLLVTQIRVEGYDGNEPLSRLYIQPEKTGTMLNYLRWLRRRGTPDTDPEQLDGSRFDITLYYSNGQIRVYRQRSGLYFSKHFRPWEKIDPEQSQYLLPILRAMPSDEEGS
jgi:hypothetical protein